MRDFKGMKRQRGRNRGGSSGGKPQQHNANRAFDSNGPEGIKVRGAAQSVFEKYQQLARDATSGGDRVLAENYLQHAEHYFRVLRAMQPTRPVSDFIGRDNFSANFDIDFEAEPEEAPVTEAGAPQPEGEGGETQREDRGGYSQNGQNGQNGQRREFRDDRPRDDRPREDRYQNDRPREDRFRDRDDRPRWQDRQRDDRPRDDRPRDDRPRDDRPRDDRPREDRYQNDRPREDRPRDDRPRDDRPRDERPRDDKPRDDRSREERFREREERRRERLERQEAVAADPMAVIEPRGETSEERGPAFRSRDGDVSEAPAFLRRQTRIEPEPAPEAPAAEPAAASEEAAPKPRRRRVKAVEE